VLKFGCETEMSGQEAPAAVCIAHPTHHTRISCHTLYFIEHNMTG